MTRQDLDSKFAQEIGDDIASDKYYAKWGCNSQKTDQEMELEKEIMSDLYITRRIVKTPKGVLVKLGLLSHR